MKNIVILISGRGSNMQAIVRACAAEGWDARIAAVISNRAEAEGLALARSLGVATTVVDHRGFASREAFDAQLADTIGAFAPDLLVLAGFMRILTPAFVRRFEGRMVNVHPSLLPAFAGLHTHRRALELGPIIAQAVVPVLAGDTEKSLSERVLAAEHRLYPLAVGWWVADLLQVNGGVVTHRSGAAQLLL